MYLGFSIDKFALICIDYLDQNKQDSKYFAGHRAYFLQKKRKIPIWWGNHGDVWVDQ